MAVTKTRNEGVVAGVERARIPSEAERLQIISRQIAGIEGELEFFLSSRCAHCVIFALEFQFILLDLRFSLGLISQEGYIQMAAERIERAVELCFNRNDVEAGAVANFIWRKVRQLNVF
jgi:hypothetical protein